MSCESSRIAMKRILDLLPALHIVQFHIWNRAASNAESAAVSYELVLKRASGIEKRRDEQTRSINVETCSRDSRERARRARSFSIRETHLQKGKGQWPALVLRGIRTRSGLPYEKTNLKNLAFDKTLSRDSIVAAELGALSKPSERNNVRPIDPTDREIEHPRY